MQPKYNTYIGARYVPKIEGEWDNTRQYENLSIVTYQGASYTSKIWVPTGIDIENEEYWACTGNYNAQVEIYRQEVKDVKSRVTVIEGKIDSYDSKIQDCNDRVTACEKKNAEQDTEIEEIKKKIDSGGGGTPVSTEGLPIIGGLLPVTEKFIRVQTDPWKNGNFPNETTTNQGMCKTPRGFAFIKQQQAVDDNTAIIEIADDGKFIRRDYFRVGHGNDICYHDGYLYVTYNFTGKTTSIRRINYETYKLDDNFEIGQDNGGWGGNISYDPRTNCLIGFKRATDGITFICYSFDKQQVTTIDKSSTPALGEYVDFHQGGTFYNGFYFILGFRCLFVYDLREIVAPEAGGAYNAESYKNLKFLGSSKLHNNCVEGLHLQEPEGITVDASGQFYISSTIYDNSVAYKHGSRGSSDRKVNNPTFFGVIDPFKATEIQTTSTLTIADEKYVVSGAGAPAGWAYNDAIYMDGSKDAPFLTFLVASMYDNPAIRIVATGYGEVPIFGDVIKTLNNGTQMITWNSSTHVKVNGPLIIKDGTYLGSRTNYLRIDKGDTPSTVSPTSTELSITLRRCSFQSVISIPNTSGWSNSFTPVNADGSAKFTVQGTYETFTNTPSVYATASCGVGANYSPVYGGAYFGKGGMYKLTGASNIAIVCPKFEDTENACIVHLINNSGGVVTGYPGSPTVLVCSDGKRRTITRDDGGLVVISDTSEFERIVFIPVNQN